MIVTLLLYCRYQSLDFRVLKATVVAPSQGYQERVLQPLGVRGEMERGNTRNCKYQETRFLD